MAVVPIEKEVDEQKAVLLKRLKGILDEISREDRIEKRDILDLLKIEEEAQIPLSIFVNRDLGILELAVKYLKEDRNKSLTDIARILNRDRRTVWSSYHFAQKKLPSRLVITQTKFHVPAKIFMRRELGVLESLTVYLKDSRQLKFSQIAQLLQRDQRTIWTAYRRATTKNEQ